MIKKHRSISLLVLCGLAALTAVATMQHGAVWALASDGDGDPSAAEARDPPKVVEKAAKTDAIPEAQLAEIRQGVEQALGLTASSVQHLDAANVAEGGVLTVKLGDRERVLRLSPYSMRSPDFRVLVQDATGTLKEVEPPPAATYRGRLADDPESLVAASLVDGQLWATIQTADEESWFVQPVRKVMPAAPAVLHVVYRSSDVIGGNGVCGVDESLIPQPAGEQGAEPEGPAPRGPGGRTEIAFDADVEFFGLNGSSVAATVADIEMLMNQIGPIYQNQVGICYALTGIIVRTAEPDPYASTDSSTLLCEFGDHWNCCVGIPRDVAHLMTGKDLDLNIVGTAWLGVICAGNFANCNGGSLDYGLSQSRFTSLLADRVNLTAHEIGHNWNACHCNQSSCTGGPADADCGIMWSSVIGSTTFGSRSVNTIIAHRNSRGCLDACLNPVHVNWQNGGFEDGSAANPFNTVGEGVNYAVVGGQIVITTGTYPENITIGRSVTLTATGGVVTIGQ